MGLKDVAFPFDTASEEDVRVALSRYLLDLGFTLDEMKFEDSFSIRLGHTQIEIKKGGEINSSSRQTKNTIVTTGRSDLLLTHNEVPLAIVEVKAPNVVISEEDRDQGLSYARLLRQMPPFTIVTNGMELKIFDTVTTEEIVADSPTETNWWKNGRRLPSMTEEAKACAARRLFTLSYSTLQEFCRCQVEREIQGLKGSAKEFKRYSPELYVNRPTPLENFPKFLERDFLCFALIGDSGVGKSNEICALAERCGDLDQVVTLFYRGINLIHGLAKAIQNDFEWEFDRTETSLAAIIRRFTDLLETHNAKLLLVIDGLDEYQGDLRRLASELVDLASRLNPSYIRLCVSCKAIDWHIFVKDREAQNILGQKTFPPNSSQTDLPGIYLSDFEDDELTQAWSKYRQTYGISGELFGETRQACRTPLMLRLVSEVYSEESGLIPDDLSSLKIFESYWQRKLGDFTEEEQTKVEQILIDLAGLIVNDDQFKVRERQAVGQILYLQSDELRRKILRFGLLKKSEIEGTTYLSFPFEKIQSFVYCFKAKEWDQITDGQLVADAIKVALQNRVGRDALLFYLELYEGQVSGWLTHLIISDLRLFISTVDRLKSLQSEKRWGSYFAKAQNTESQNISAEDGDQKLTTLSPNFRFPFFDQTWQRKFRGAYFRLPGKFPSIENRINPHYWGSIGIWVSYEETDNNEEKWFTYGFRTTTVECPDTVIKLNVPGTDQMRMQLLMHDEKFKRVVLPDKSWQMIFGNPFIRDFTFKVPEVVAWKRLCNRVCELAHYRMLDESNCPKILLERINTILCNEPSSYWDNSPIGKFWQFLGYKTTDDLKTTSLNMLRSKIKNLINEWKKNVPYNSGKSTNTWYKQNIKCLFILDYYIEKYSQIKGSINWLFLDEEMLNRSEINRILETDLEEAKIIIFKLIDDVIDSLMELVSSNFQCLISDFKTINFCSSQLVIELYSMDVMLPIGSKKIKRIYYYLTFIWLPSIPKNKPEIRVVRKEESVFKQFGQGGNFSHDLPIEITIGGKRVAEPKAIISQIEFPTSYLLAEQVYQLLANEANKLFSEDSWINAQRANGFQINEAIKIFEEIGLIPDLFGDHRDDASKSLIIGNYDPTIPEEEWPYDVAVDYENQQLCFKKPPPKGAKISYRAIVKRD